MVAARKPFVTVQFTPETRDALRKVSLELSLALGRRVSMPDAFSILNAVAQNHPEEITEAARRLLIMPTASESRKDHDQ